MSFEMAQIEKGKDIQFEGKSAAQDVTRKQETLVRTAWSSEDDPRNPQNWSTARKWAITLMLSGFAMLPPLSSTIISPAQFTIGKDLQISDNTILGLCLSIFNLGVGIGPLIMSPLSETFGRYPVLLVGNIFFLAWNLGLGFVQREGELIACRFFSGIGANAALSIMGAVMGDIWPPEKRAGAIGVATFVPLLSPGLAPIVGGYIDQYTSWRWILWGLSIIDAVWLCIGTLFLEETYAPVILRRSNMSTVPNVDKEELVGCHQYYSIELFSRIGKSLVRPCILLATQSVVQILCFFLIFSYGTLFLNLYSFPLLWTNIYRQDTGQGSLNYISTTIGCVLGAQVLGPLNDKIYCALKQRNAGDGCPEFRLPLLVVASIFIVVGLIVLGWTGQNHVYWLVPKIGNVIFLAGVTLSAQVVQTYTVDAFTLHAASALSTENFVRSVASFLFPLFAPSMYERLGWGWTSSILGLLTVVAGLATATTLWIYGFKLRQRSKTMK